MLRHRNANGPDGYESDDAAYEVQADGKVVCIGEDFKEVEEGEVEEDGVDQCATNSCNRKTQTEKAPAKKQGSNKEEAKGQANAPNPDKEGAIKEATVRKNIKFD